VRLPESSHFFLFAGLSALRSRYHRRRPGHQTAIVNRTATAQALEGANLSTLQAATATSAWLALDSDNDGLTNSNELLLALARITPIRTTTASPMG